MKKIFNFSMTVIVFSVIQYFFLRNYYLESNFVSDMITFLSVIFGFYVTGFAIFSTSRYVACLYDVVDKKDSSKTLLHTLFDNYRFGLIHILIAIVYFLIVEFALSQIKDQRISLSNLLLVPFLGIFVNIIWYSYRMLNDLVKVVVQEAKNKKD